MVRGSRRTPIGLDAYGRYVNAVQLTGSGTRWRLVAAVSQPRASAGEPLDATEIADIARMLERRGFKGRQVVLAMPSESVRAETVSVSARATRESLPQVAREAVAKSYRCDDADIECAWWDLPGRNNGLSTVMAMGCRTEVATRLADTIEAGGLRPLGLDAQAWALARACAPRLADAKGVSAVLNIDWAAATVVICCDGVVVYERTLAESGVNRLQSRLMTGLGLDADVSTYLLEEVGLGTDRGGDVEASQLVDVHRQIRAFLERLEEELRQSLAYASQEFGGPIDRVLMTGDGATVPELDQGLAEALDLAVETVSPRDVVECPSTISRSDSPLLTTALGLAQYGRASTS